ncbi:hypothetical protein, partial [Levilactobacillus brevis]|uniref:hypothetical protein n=2 Tax=Levilactobacillus brevis TaxID=1580 RepID=UPI001CDB3EF1
MFSGIKKWDHQPLTPGDPILLVLQYLLLVIDFHLLLMTDFLFMARIKKRTFPVRSSKSTTTKI